jgi:hypothetical protein
MNLSPLEKRHGTFQHERLEVWHLPMVKKCLLAHILLVQEKFIWIVARPVNDELQVARLPTNFFGQLAQDLFDLLDLTFSGTPSGDDHVCHGFTSLKRRKLRKLPTTALPLH